MKNHTLVTQSQQGCTQLHSNNGFGNVIGGPLSRRADMLLRSGITGIGSIVCPIGTPSGAWMEKRRFQTNSNELRPVAIGAETETRPCSWCRSGEACHRADVEYHFTTDWNVREQAFAFFSAHNPSTENWRYACKELELAERGRTLRPSTRAAHTRSWLCRRNLRRKIAVITGGSTRYGPRYREALCSRRRLIFWRA